MTTDREVTPLDQFPELRHVIDLRTAGWMLLPEVVDGEVVELRGVRVWPRGWVDAIRVHGISDTLGLRCDDAGHVVWQRAGSLADVVVELLALPAPS
jgi:hypothetical protein